MAKYEVTKSFEAVKCNRRSGLPLGEPPLTLSFGAILEDVVEDRDVYKFKYLGEPYRAPVTKMSGAYATLGGEQPAPAKAAPKPSSPSLPIAGSPSANDAHGSEMLWESVPSTIPTLRAKVPGGWLVSVTGVGLTFYPDPNHLWRKSH